MRNNPVSNPTSAKRGGYYIGKRNNPVSNPNSVPSALGGELSGKRDIRAVRHGVEETKEELSCGRSMVMGRLRRASECVCMRVCVCDACVMKAVRSMRAALCLLALAPRNSHRLLPSNGKRCAVSDGGEETKEHEEVTVHGALKKAKNHPRQFSERAASRASGSSFSARPTAKPGEGWLALTHLLAGGEDALSQCAPRGPRRCIRQRVRCPLPPPALHRLSPHTHAHTRAAVSPSSNPPLSRPRSPPRLCAWTHSTYAAAIMSVCTHAVAALEGLPLGQRRRPPQVDSLESLTRARGACTRQRECVAAVSG